MSCTKAPATRLRELIFAEWKGEPVPFDEVRDACFACGVTYEQFQQAAVAYEQVPRRVDAMIADARRITSQDTTNRDTAAVKEELTAIGGWLNFAFHRGRALEQYRETFRNNNDESSDAILRRLNLTGSRDKLSQRLESLLELSEQRGTLAVELRAAEPLAKELEAAELAFADLRKRVEAIPKMQAKIAELSQQIEAAIGEIESKARELIAPAAVALPTAGK
jgi:DNA repair exonuclease SbcCD ATPase subunit